MTNNSVDNLMHILRIMHQTNYKYSAREVAAVLFRKG